MFDFLEKESSSFREPHEERSMHLFGDFIPFARECLTPLLPLIPASPDVVEHAVRQEQVKNEVARTVPSVEAKLDEAAEKEVAELHQALENDEQITEELEEMKREALAKIESLQGPKQD